MGGLCAYTKTFIMENNNMILSDQTVNKEYQIPELIDLNSVNEAMAGGINCTTGSAPSGSCITGNSIY